MGGGTESASFAGYDTRVSAVIVLRLFNNTRCKVIALRCTPVSSCQHLLKGQIGPLSEVPFDMGFKGSVLFM